MIFGEGRVIDIAARLIQCLLVFLVVHIADAFEEQQREDELLVVAGVNHAAQQRRRAPEIGFELLLRDRLCRHIHKITVPPLRHRQPVLRVCRRGESLHPLPKREVEQASPNCL